MLLVSRVGIMLLLWISLLCQPVWASGDYDRLSDTREYRAVGDNAYPPLIFVNTKGQQDGYDIDVMHLLEKHSTNRFNIVLMDWENAKKIVATGGADILIGVNKTSSRGEFFDFTEPYLETKWVILTQKNNFIIKELGDLENRRVGVQQGAVPDEILRAHIPPMSIYSYTSQKEALADLAEGKIDAVVGAYVTGMYLINQHDWQDKIKIVGEPVAVTEYCLGVKKGNHELLQTLNKGIDAAKKTGQLQQLQDKWFGESYFSSTFIRNPRFLKLLAWLLGIVAVIMGVGMLFVYSLRRKVDVATSRLREANKELANAYEVTIRAFFNALEKRESGTARHSLAVNSIALEIGREMKLSETELLHLTWGTLLHDIGKLAISDDILLKEGKLTDEEYDNIKRHPQIGYEILQGAEYLHQAAEITLYHQERYDGKGYPYGLAGEKIPLLARICTVADAFEAMIADRPYRKGRNIQEAVAEILKNRGSQFDPYIVDTFIKLDHSKFLDENRS